MWSVVQEFSSDGGNVPTHHPAMEELPVLARWSERGTATLGLVTVIEIIIDDEDNMLIEAKQAHKEPFDIPMDGIFSSLSPPKIRSGPTLMF